MTTAKHLADLTGQWNEIVKRVANGSLDPTSVKWALQGIIEGNLPSMWNWSPPTWWRTPEQQLKRAHELWPNTDLPEPPKKFTPRTKSEVQLLHVPDTFYSLWDKVVAPTGYTKHLDRIKTDKQNLRLSPNKREYTEPVWLAFDPEHGKGKHPNSFWGQADIAASEVLSALIQFPEWPLAWLNGASAPNLSGYQNRRDGSWSGVPSFRLWEDGWLTLDVYWLDGGYPLWSSPSVREC